jgi:Flp pilus assembly protein TadG
MKRQRQRQRGAAMVEFVVAVMPMLITFFSFVQLGKLMTARLVLQHATKTALRTATLTPKGDPRAMNDSGKIREAAQDALGQWSNQLTISVSPSQGGGVHGLVNVTVNATYRCDVPLGSLLVCGGGSKKLKPITLSMPLQGGDYTK